MAGSIPFLLAMALAGSGSPLQGQVAGVTPDVAAPQSEQEADRYLIHLITIGVGEAIWERFGHNGLLVQDRLTGEEIVFEWGQFSFGQVDFIPRLARGEMLYSMGAAYLTDVVRKYAADDRSVWAQELALTPAQEERLVGALYTNYEPENQQYLYDYYEDNCSTRLRDALDAVLNGAIYEQLAGVETGRSWRWHTRRLLQSDLGGYIGIQFVLGHPGDRKIDRWEEMFLPLQMRDFAAQATIPDPAGGRRPLVVAERVLVPETGKSVKAAPDSWLGRAAAIGLGAGLFFFGLGALGARLGAARALLGLLGSLTSVILGLAGTLVLIAGLFTDHDFWAWNETILLATPLSILLGLLLMPMWIGRRPSERTVRVARWVSAIALAALLMRALPILGQDNLEVIAVLLPLHLGMAGALARARLTPDSTPR